MWKEYYICFQPKWCCQEPWMKCVLGTGGAGKRRSVTPFISVSINIREASDMIYFPSFLFFSLYLSISTPDHPASFRIQRFYTMDYRNNLGYHKKRIFSTNKKSVWTMLKGPDMMFLCTSRLFPLHHLSIYSVLNL